MNAAGNRPPTVKSEPTGDPSRPYYRVPDQTLLRGSARSLPALLHVGPDELLGVLFEHLVDLVQDRVHVVGQGLLPFLDILGGLRLGLLGLLAAPRGLPLS